ncbi:probable G-protein coupled receptor 139 [Hemiscyllium ocellatum]|uniref:probable G-protein coupled receptor 139 n=1 Tax=Hemiscyllium ocellatum TaxID=170820 RepID=UPI0029664E37|nr:probable G-protein coupled receptor 139 [Hemiscyllium ocellatum]
MHEPAVGPLSAICYTILAVVGTAANLVAIIILCRGQCGLSRCITCYSVAIAVSDFFVIIFAVILNRIIRLCFNYSLISTTPGCRFSTVLVYVTQDCSVWLTLTFTINRFIAICCQSLKLRYYTEKSASMVKGILCALSCIKNIPFYFIYQPLYVVDGVPWFCDIKSTFYTLPIWHAYDWLDYVLTLFLPFVLVLLLNALTVKYILIAMRARKRLLSMENGTDQEMVKRRMSIVLLFTISLSFLCLWVMYVGRFVYVRVTGKGYFTGLDVNDLQTIFQETTNMFQLLSSCNNFFIYAGCQHKFRKKLQKVLTSPFNAIIGFIKQ